MAKLIIDTNVTIGKINRNIYGHFSEHLGRCIYGGLFVGKDSVIPNTNGVRNDVAEALKNIKIPVLRWPGGCFADEYHWKDGIGSARKKMINTHWGGVVEDNSFGTHEFFELCEQLECEPYIAGNLGSGTVQEMSEWIEYITFNGISPMTDLRTKNGRTEPWILKYFGVGNENWGGGGNMRAEYYANEYRRYQTYCRNYGNNKIYKIACGSGTEDYNWTETLMKYCTPFMDAMSIHYYTIPGDWNEKGSATVFSNNTYYLTLEKARKIEGIIDTHLDVMDKYDPEHKIDLVIDEWGTWFDVEEGTNPGFLYQQNTMRDALVAALSLDIFNAHCTRISMTNIAQIVNVLQSMILTEGEKMILTPTYHVYDLYKRHQDATCVAHSIDNRNVCGLPQLSSTASCNEIGEVTLTISNISLTDNIDISTLIRGSGVHTAIGRVLTNKADAYNTFDKPKNVKLETLKVKIKNGEVIFTLPPCSIAEIVLK